MLWGMNKCKICKKQFTINKSPRRTLLGVLVCSNSCRIKFQNSRYSEKERINLNEKIRLAKIGDKNPMWAGNNVGYHALHDWIKKRLAKPSKCSICNKVTASNQLDLANISQEYKRDLSDWEWLCRKCHMNKDGRLVNMIKRNKTEQIKKVSEYWKKLPQYKKEIHLKRMKEHRKKYWDNLSSEEKRIKMVTLSKSAHNICKK